MGVYGKGRHKENGGAPNSGKDARPSGEIRRRSARGSFSTNLDPSKK